MVSFWSSSTPRTWRPRAQIFIHLCDWTKYTCMFSLRVIIRKKYIYKHTTNEKHTYVYTSSSKHTHAHTLLCWRSWESSCRFLAPFWRQDAPRCRQDEPTWHPRSPTWAKVVFNGTPLISKTFKNLLFLDRFFLCLFSQSIQRLCSLLKLLRMFSQLF